MPIPKPIRPVCEKCKESGAEITRLNAGEWEEPFVVDKGKWVCVFCFYMGKPKEKKRGK